MLSMTGFGSGRAADGRGSVTVQIASGNHRSCQIQVRGDLRDLALEERVRAAVRERVRRGSVTVRVGLETVGAGAWDRESLAGAWRELKGLADELGAPPPTLEGVARLLGTGGSCDPADAATVDAALGRALDNLVDARRREGESLAAAFEAMLAEFVDLRVRLRDAAAARQPAYRERLLARVREALPDLGAADETAIVRECALQADRIDVAEELVRLESHCARFAECLADGGEGPIGRRLEFLVQEMLREVNTVGAKAGDAALAGLAVEAKSVLERMREQAANVE